MTLILVLCQNPAGLATYGAESMGLNNCKHTHQNYSLNKADCALSFLYFVSQSSNWIITSQIGWH